MRVLVTDPIAQEGVDRLKTQAEVDVQLGLKGPALVGAIGAYDALVVRSETKVTAAVIEAGKRLQVIGRAGVGVDNIDVEAATRRGIVVVNAPAGNIIATAEHTIAMLLAAARHIPQAQASLKAGEWKRSRFMGIEVRGKTLGILGLGKVGSQVARRAPSLELHVIAHDPYVSPEHARSVGAELVSLEELLRRSDFLTVHVPLTEATRGLLGRGELAAMKPAAILINCARGGIVDEEALLEAVEEGRLAGAAVDVFSEEPAIGNILLQSDRIVVTPHLAASTAEAQVNVALDVAEQVLAVLRGQAASYAVNLPLIPPEALAVLTPFVGVAVALGQLVTQLAEGQMEALRVTYSGDIAEHDTSPLTAALIKGLLGAVTEEPVNLVNAAAVAKRRGLRITEQRGTAYENYNNLITVELQTTVSTVTVAGTFFRGEPHIVYWDGYWVDVVPCGFYWLVTHHRDRPGMIGAVGTILGKNDINISCMVVGRLQPRGQAVMILGVDDAIPEGPLQEIRAINDIHMARVIRL